MIVVPFTEQSGLSLRPIPCSTYQCRMFSTSAMYNEMYWKAEEVWYLAGLHKWAGRIPGPWYRGVCPVLPLVDAIDFDFEMERWVKWLCPYRLFLKRINMHIWFWIASSCRSCYGMSCLYVLLLPRDMKMVCCWWIPRLHHAMLHLSMHTKTPPVFVL